MNSIKKAVTSYPVLEVIRNRWSPRAFSDKIIDESSLNSLFEAASWAASAANEQPWQYIYASRGSDGFNNIWDCLLPGNQPWAKHAACLVIAVARTTYQASGKANPYAQHDLGMANAHLLLQASANGIYSHAMAGFNRNALIETIKLADNQDPICVIALGYLSAPDSLEEPFRSREQQPRSRKQLSAFTFKI